MNQIQYSNLTVLKKMEVFLSELTHNSYLLSNRLDGFISDSFESSDQNNIAHLKKIISYSLRLNAELTKQIAEFYSFIQPDDSKSDIPEGKSRVIFIYSHLLMGNNNLSDYIIENKDILPKAVVEHFERYIHPNYEALLKNLMDEHSEILANYINRD